MAATNRSRSLAQVHVVEVDGVAVMSGSKAVCGFSS